MRANEPVERNQIRIAHGIYKLNIALADVLEQILTFLASTKQEIVIIDFHRFENGFEKSGAELKARHEQVQSMILSYLRPYLVTADLGLNRTIRELAQLDKRVIVGYNYDHRNAQYFFQKTLHVWADTDDRGTLMRYLGDRSCRSTTNAHYLVSLMAELTPRVFRMIRDKYGGLRVLAQQVNHQVTVQVFEEWWHCMNVISTDYFLGTNVIEYAIQANLRRAKHL